MALKWGHLASQRQPWLRVSRLVQKVVGVVEGQDGAEDVYAAAGVDRRA